MKIPGVENFEVEEFLHPSVFAFCNRGDGTERWRWFVSQFQIDFAVLMREVTDGAIVVNNWHKGGKYVGRGHRPANYRPSKGGIFSQHYLSKALDISSPRYTPLQLLSKIEANWEKFEAIGLTTIENPRITVTWLHGDSRARIQGVHPEKGFLIVEP